MSLGASAIVSSTLASSEAWGLVTATGLIALLALLLPRGARSQLRQPILFLGLHLALRAVLVFAPEDPSAWRVVSFGALAFVLASIGRSAVLLVLDVILGRRRRSLPDTSVASSVNGSPLAASKSASPRRRRRARKSAARFYSVVFAGSFRFRRLPLLSLARTLLLRCRLGGESMQAKCAIIVALFAVGCGGTFEAAPGGGAEAGADGHASSDAALGDAAPDADGSSASDGASSDAVADAAGDAGGKDGESDAAGWSPDCPDLQPKVGAACSNEGLQCEYLRLAYLYKVEYDVACDILFECSQGAWADASISSECKPDGPNSTACPPTYGKITIGGVCDDNGLRCEYATGVCTCAVPLGGPITTIDAGATWGCNPGPGCPMPRPRLGSACATPQTTCTYEACAYEETCGTDGIWQGMQTVCEIPGVSP